MADKLHGVFLAAGLPAPTMRMKTFVGGGRGDHRVASSGWPKLPTTLLPAMEKFGVATAAEVGLATLAERMMHEVACRPTA